MRPPRLLLLSSSLLAVAACGNGTDLDARFTGVDSLKVQRAFEAATGGDEGDAIAVGLGYAALPASNACPAIVHDGNVTTVTTDCITAEGTSLSGSIRIENAPLAGFDPSQPTLLTFDGYVDRALGYDKRYQGDISFTRTEMTADFELAIGNLIAHSVIDYDGGTKGIHANAGSNVWVDGVGGADVSGTWKLPSIVDGHLVAGTGQLTMTGAQTMIVDISQKENGGCYPATVDGEGYAICGF